MATVALLSIVAFGNDGVDEYQRMQQHRQCDCHQLREMRLHAAGDEVTDTESHRPRDNRKTTERDQNTV